jgi:hypothetical protein
VTINSTGQCRFGEVGERVADGISLVPGVIAADGVVIARRADCPRSRTCRRNARQPMAHPNARPNQPAGRHRNQIPSPIGTDPAIAPTTLWVRVRQLGQMRDRIPLRTTMNTAPPIVLLGRPLIMRFLACLVTSSHGWGMTRSPIFDTQLSNREIQPACLSQPRRHRSDTVPHLT